MAAPLVAAGIGVGLMKVLQNRTFWIIVGAIIIFWIIYKAGKNAQKAADERGSWWDRLWGNVPKDPEPGTVYVPSPGSDQSWRPNTITDTIHRAYEDHRWYSGNSAGINSAWSVFNGLNDSQKIAVINDWSARHQGTDKPGWGTGDYGSLKTTIEEYSDNLVPQAEIALSWMRAAAIE